MKIAFDAKRAYHNLTGLGNYSRSVISSISKIQKNDILYLITPKKNDEVFDINNANINIITPNTFTNKSYWRFTGVNQQLNNIKVDIYHGLSNEIPYKIKTKNIVTIHDLLFLKHPHFYNYIDRKIYHFKSKFACQNSDKIIATSQQTKQDIINYFNIKENKIEVIYQSCHQDFIAPPNNQILDISIQNELKNPFLLYVGSIEERKNLIFLLKAIKKIKDVRLICVGKKGRYYKKVARFINENNLHNKVVFLNINNTKQLASVYKSSRGLVYPSINEGFGIPIIEGMYSKIPVITSDKPIFKEVGGKSSYYFEEGKLDSLIEKIQEIWDDSHKRDTRIQTNFKYVQKFNEKRQAEKIISLYKKII